MSTGVPRSAQFTLAVRRLQTLVNIVHRLLRHKLLKVIGPVLASIVWFLVAFVTKVCLVNVLPELQFAGIVGRVAIAGLGLCQLFNMLYNYAQSSRRDAGTPPEYAAAAASSVETGWQPPPSSWQCKRCGLLKEPRTHHCSVCQRCVRKMDHHCPWVNNCVGAGNYRFFCLFLWWSVILSCYVLPILLPFCLDPWQGQSLRDVSLAELVEQVTVNAGSPVRMVPSCSLGRAPLHRCASLATIFTFMLLVATSTLGATHVLFVLLNMTSIEAAGFVNAAVAEVLRTWFCQERARTLPRRLQALRHQHYKGLLENFREVFGASAQPLRLWWMLSFLPQSDLDAAAATEAANARGHKKASSASKSELEMSSHSGELRSR